MFTKDDLPTLHRMQAAAKRISDLMHARACNEFGLAFGHNGGSQLNMCVVHNSLAARENGRPWSEVNYDHMRRCAWIIEKSYEPSRLVNAWYSRKCAVRS